MDSHLRQKSEEAQAMLAGLLAREPKDSNGNPQDPVARHLAQEHVLSQLMDYPTPPDQQNPEMQDVPQRQMRSSKGPTTTSNRAR